jgi:hypothetical protein
MGARRKKAPEGKAGAPNRGICSQGPKGLMFSIPIGGSSKKL